MYFHGNIEQLTLSNNNYRKVLFTGKYSQLVVMTLKPGEEIGAEIHKGHDQFVRIEEGIAVAQLGDKVHNLHHDDAIIIPSGMLREGFFISSATLATFKRPA